MRPVRVLAPWLVLATGCGIAIWDPEHHSNHHSTGSSEGTGGTEATSTGTGSEDFTCVSCESDDCGLCSNHEGPEAFRCPDARAHGPKASCYSDGSLFAAGDGTYYRCWYCP